MFSVIASSANLSATTTSFMLSLHAVGQPTQCKMFVFLSCVNIVCSLFILCVDSMRNAVCVFWRAQLRVLLFL